MIEVGGIFHHDAFYADPDSGELLGKYLLVLALPRGNDIVFRVLTSRHANHRPSGCHHGDPYPGFALGVPGGELSKPSWVDLRAQDDYDIDVFRGRLGKAVIRHVMRLDAVPLRAAMACAAAADDTSNHQARCIRDAMAELAG
ncbi:hypothetical protein [Silanimonas sp.]|jgi:hypothetical protein|uniref:hypothetical protein n=1 Tax=Silanimonas sp. TaxID=1929290 RepID=UPI0037CB8D47